MPDCKFSLGAVCQAELDDQWSYVGNRSNQPWLWYTVDHTSKLMCSANTRRWCSKLKALLNPLGISRYYTDDWGTY